MDIYSRITRYITRYAPSEKRLRMYISRNIASQDISYILAKVCYSEIFMCNLWLQTLVSFGVSEQEIYRKLQKKWFPKNKIQQWITDFIADIRDWDMHKARIEFQIDQYIGKWKSKTHTRNVLMKKYPYFRDKIDELMRQKTDTSWLEKEIEKYLLRYDISHFSDKKKFFSTLQRKGFLYRDIVTCLNSLQDE